MADLLPALGSLGGGGVIAALIVYLLNSIRAGQKDSREAVADADRRADAAEQRAREAIEREDAARTAQRNA
ncbi:MAG: hypothetical protein ACRD0P_22365, partial [Stackebrandtia sp.]